MCLEFQTALYHHSFRIPVQETPLSLGIQSSLPWCGMYIYWNHPFTGRLEVRVQDLISREKETNWMEHPTQVNISEDRARLT